jgi:glycerol-3-phosphate dehydrogenase
MNRAESIKQIENTEQWDVIVIGGGATGLGSAVEAASRGYRTLLLEQFDFAKATSSRSTKLIHGGVRYLQQGNISLVLEALHERGLLFKNAPHLVQHQSFIVPNYDWWSGPFYGIGLKVYDLLAGDLGLGPSRLLSREETLAEIPTIESEGLRGGVIYYDGQFDDARLAITLARTLDDIGGVPVNYMRVTGLLKQNDLIYGVEALDSETGKQHRLNARVVINATGIFTDQILHMDEPAATNLLSLSQGIHLVLDKCFLPGDSAIMVPHTDDGRVLFAVPWLDRVIVGTTDTPVNSAEAEPKALEEEIDFVLQHAGRYLQKDPARSDVLSVFAGIRPLVRSGNNKNTAELSRDHYLAISHSGLVTITGGKWTTYRKMAEDTINQAALIAGLPQKECITQSLHLHGWIADPDEDDRLAVYGNDLSALQSIIDKDNSAASPIHKALPYTFAEVRYAVEHEMARTVEDILARRTRSLLLDAQAAIECAPVVAEVMSRVLNRSAGWQEKQVEQFSALAGNYLIQ